MSDRSRYSVKNLDYLKADSVFLWISFVLEQSTKGAGMGESQGDSRKGFIRQVTQGLKKAIADPVMYNKPRVLDEMLKIQHEFRPAFNYFTRQHEILPFMRQQVAQWMHDVS